MFKLWKKPDNYFGPDWTGYYAVYRQRPSSDALTRANFKAILERLGGESSSVVVASDSHWASGEVETIYLLASDTEKVAIMEQIDSDMAQYPILDEDLLNEEEDKAAAAVWRDCFTVKDRLQHLRTHKKSYANCFLGDFSRLRACVRGEYPPWGDNGYSLFYFGG